LQTLVRRFYVVAFLVNEHKEGYMPNFVRRRRKFVLAAVLALLIASGVAIAAWLTNGTGPGKAKAGQVQTLTVQAASNAPSSASDQLYPGSDGAAAVKITNSNGPLVIVGVQPGGLGAQDSSDAAGCDASNISVNTLSGLSIPLPSGTTDNVLIPGALHMSSGAPTECQGATFTKSVKVLASTP
jgi:hypothetical protein